MSKARVVFWVFKVGKGVAMWKFLAAEAAINGAVAGVSYWWGRRKRK